MDISALRKLAITLKPLVEIADVLEKVQVAEDTLASIKGQTVAANRELNDAKEAAIKARGLADAEAKKSIDSAKIRAKDIIDVATVNAQQITDNATKDVKNQAAKWSADIKILTENKAAIQKDLSDMESRKTILAKDVASAEKTLAALKEAIAKIAGA